MIWIELLGPSGVGKSYWYAHFMERYPEFEPKRLLLKRIYQQRKELNFSPKVKVFFFLYHLKVPKISNFFKNQIFQYFLNRGVNSSKTNLLNEVIAQKYLANVQKYNEPQISILSKIQYFASKLSEFRLYEYFLEENDIYIAEDGLLHLSPVFFNEIEPNWAIVLKRKRESIMKQRAQRAQKNPRYIEVLLKGEELADYMDNYFNLYNAKTRALNPNITLPITPTNKKLQLEEVYNHIMNNVKNQK